MNAERWRLVTEIFHTALAHPSDERPVYLLEACRDDRPLREAVDALLAGDRRAELAGDPLGSSQAALSPGDILGPYRVDALLDAGGMGEVYKARDTRLNRDVAIKVLPARLSADPDRLARFEREAHAAAALNHPNICAVFDIGSHDGAPFIVSELLEGETLRHVCEAGLIPVQRAIEITVPIARGLAAAHAKGIVHRDLKPDNIFVTVDTRVKILDFGLAKLMTEAVATGGLQPEAGHPLTEAGIVMGTVGYMAPEQVRGLPADSRSDIFSFGSVLFEMLTGRRPFAGETTADTLSAILREDPPAMAAGSAVPPQLDRLVRRCLEKTASNRFQSADDLAFALEAVPLTATPAAAAPIDVRRPLAGLLAPLGMALALAAVVLAAAWRWTPPVVDPGAYRFTPFATDAGSPNNPAWSPDGHSIAYDGQVNGRRQVFVRALDTDASAQITHEPLDATRPFWWSDAGRIGYLSGGKVWAVSLAGGGPELVQQDWVGAATLSPDGRTLAMWRGDTALDTWGVWLASPPSAVPREYTPAPFQKSRIRPFRTISSFRPTASNCCWLAGAMRERAPSGCCRFQPARFHRIVFFQSTSSRSYPEPPTQLAWMPDSRRAVMVLRSSSAPRGGLWVMDVLTSAVTPASMGLTQHHNPSVSRDSKLAFTAGGPGYDLVEVPLNGAPMRDVLASGSDEYSGAWVPGSSNYVYLTTKNGEQELRIHSQTENWDRLIIGSHSFDGMVLNSPVASPDGQRVAYEVWGVGGGFASLWSSPVGGGVRTKLTPEGANESGAAWSPDGLALACYHEEGGVTALESIRVGSTDPPRQLARNVAGASIPAWSPDGEWIAYRTPAGPLQLVGRDGVHQRALGSSFGRAFVWSRDGRSLFTTRRTDGRTVEVVAIDAASGSSRVVSILGGDFNFATPDAAGLRFTLGPDGTSFLGTVMRMRTDLWILEDFVPRGGIFGWLRR